MLDYFRSSYLIEIWQTFCNTLYQFFSTRLTDKEVVHVPLTCASIDFLSSPASFSAFRNRFELVFFEGGSKIWFGSCYLQREFGHVRLSYYDMKIKGKQIIHLLFTMLSFLLTGKFTFDPFRVIVKPLKNWN